MIVACDCSAKLKIDDSKVGDKGARIRCPRCGTILTVHRDRSPASPAAGPVPASVTVLVAHENEAVRRMVGEVLAGAGMAMEAATDGVEALRKAMEQPPQVALIDVGLPGIYVFELCERLRETPQTSSIRIILLTSVYDVSRYKRSPVSFYGADDYIEQHQISALLVPKIRALLSGVRPPVPEPVAAPAAHRPRETAGEGDLSGFLREVMGSAQAAAPEGREQRSWPGDSLPPEHNGSALLPESFSLDASVFDPSSAGAVPAVEEQDPEAVEKAKRLARIIVSDIALYNQEAVSEGIRSGTFFELLRDDVEEGRRLYEERVPASIRARRDYYREAFDTFIAAQKNKIHR